MGGAKNFCRHYCFSKKEADRLFPFKQKVNHLVQDKNYKLINNLDTNKISNDDPQIINQTIFKLVKKDMQTYHAVSNPDQNIKEMQTRQTEKQNSKEKVKSQPKKDVYPQSKLTEEEIKMFSSQTDNFNKDQSRFMQKTISNKKIKKNTSTSAQYNRDDKSLVVPNGRYYTDLKANDSVDSIKDFSLADGRANLPFSAKTPVKIDLTTPPANFELSSRSSAFNNRVSTQPQFKINYEDFSIENLTERRWVSGASNLGYMESSSDKQDEFKLVEKMYEKFERKNEQRELQHPLSINRVKNWMDLDPKITESEFYTMDVNGKKKQKMEIFSTPDTAKVRTNLKNINFMDFDSFGSGDENREAVNAGRIFKRYVRDYKIEKSPRLESIEKRFVMIREM